MNEIQRNFTRLVEEATGHQCVCELLFHPTRKWRFDYAIPAAMVAIEVEGGAYTQGRHTRGRGFEADMEKYNTAEAMGWHVLRVTPERLCAPKTIGIICQTVRMQYVIRHNLGAFEIAVKPKPQNIETREDMMIKHIYLQHAAQDLTRQICPDLEDQLMKNIEESLKK